MQQTNTAVCTVVPAGFQLSREKVAQIAAAEQTVWLQLYVLDDGEDTQENAVTLPSIKCPSRSTRGVRPAAQQHLVPKPVALAAPPHRSLEQSNVMHDYLDAHLAVVDAQGRDVVDENPATRIEGRLLVAPLGRHYHRLFVGESARRSCRFKTYRLLFTRRCAEANHTKFRSTTPTSDKQTNIVTVPNSPHSKGPPVCGVLDHAASWSSRPRPST
eukprot:SAG22_NODE_1526_length_4224_cov_3.171394_2_plen_215_part_00